MPLPPPKFDDGQIWDGTTPHTRPNINVYKHVDGEIGNRHSSEIIALEKLLKDIINEIEVLKNLGAANSLLSVKSDQTGLEYKKLIQGGGITISYGAGIITISATSAIQLEAEADSQIKIGNPIYLKANGHTEPAKADNINTVQVVGVSISDTAATYSCKYITEGQVERVDWTEIAGTASLSPGISYFLDIISGKITTIAPTTTRQYVVRIGRAVSTIRLDVEIELPILL